MPARHLPTVEKATLQVLKESNLVEAMTMMLTMAKKVGLPACCCFFSVVALHLQVSHLFAR